MTDTPKEPVSISDPTRIQIPGIGDLVRVLGVPGAIAIFLVWRLASGFDGIQRQMEETNKQLVNLSANDRVMANMIGVSQMLAEQTVWVLRQMCVNAANTPQERVRCMSSMPVEELEPR